MTQTKLLTKRFGNINPLDINDYIKLDGYKSLQKALKIKPAKIIKEMEDSRIRGRGGAGFPAYIKLKGLAAEKKQKYIICNADEGEPANFKDRFLMEQDPHQIIEGMAILARATGATKGFIYIRGEYVNAINIMKEAINQAVENGFIGDKTIKDDFSFNIEVRSGAGSYVCGEEFALIESIEGKPGRTRVKPPFPTEVGVFKLPTLINNVETFANVPHIINMGGIAYSKTGTKSSTGTKLISLSGNVKNRGVFEVPFGTPIGDIIYKLGDGIKDNRRLKMIQLGGACGPFIPPFMIDMNLDFDRFEEFESKVGAGSIMVVDERFDLFEILLKTMNFFEHESCGKCTPCREGHTHLIILLNRFINFVATHDDLLSLESLARVMHQTSLCGLGQTSPTPIISSIRFFREEFIERIESSVQGVCRL